MDFYGNGVYNTSHKAVVRTAYSHRYILVSCVSGVGFIKSVHSKFKSSCISQRIFQQIRMKR